MKKPNFLKTRNEKIIDRVVTSIEFIIAVKDYRDKKEKEKLELENQRLQNALLQKKLNQDKLKILQP